MPMDEQEGLPPAARAEEGRFVRVGMSLADWSQRWFPDAFIFALIGVVIVFFAGLLTGSEARDLVKYFGDGFWSLIPLTMQMALIIVGGYVVASSPPVQTAPGTAASCRPRTTPVSRRDTAPTRGGTPRRS